MGTESLEQRRVDRFNELLSSLGDIDDFENSPTRLYIETAGGSIPRRLSRATVERIIAQLNEEIPTDNARQVRGTYGYRMGGST